MTRSASGVVPAALLAGLLAGALSCSLLTSLDGLSGGPNDPGDGGSKGDGGGTGDGGGNRNDAGPAAQSPYASAVLADAPLAFFRLNETGGTVATSVVGSITGKYEGNFAFGAAGAGGDGDPSVTFDGTTTRLDLGDVFAFEGTASFTLECWIKPTVAGDTRFIFERKTLATPTAGYTLYFGATYFTFSRSSQGNEFAYTGPNGPPRLDVWTHTVITYDGTTSFMYLDGAVAGENQGASMPIGGGAGTFVIGDDAPGQFNKLEGQLDEVAIYDHALPAARILAHFQAAKR